MEDILFIQLFVNLDPFKASFPECHDIYTCSHNNYWLRQHHIIHCFGIEFDSVSVLLCVMGMVVEHRIFLINCRSHYKARCRISIQIR